MTAAVEPVTLATTGPPRPLSPGLELSAYRIIQEALTKGRAGAACAGWGNGSRCMGAAWTPRRAPGDRRRAGGLAELVVSLSTVKTHLGHVLDKRGLRDRVHAMVYGYGHGLVEPGNGTS